jgi:hypothetical protein
MRRTLAKRRMLLAGIVLPALCLAACSLLVDVDGLAGNRAPMDAGFESATLPVDASPDAVAVDAGPDGVAEGGCGVTFCDNFDTRPIGEGWTKVELTDGVSLDRGEGRSKPYALRARTLNMSGKQTSDPVAMLTQKLPPGSRIKCSFGVFLVKTPNQSFSDLFGIHTETNGLANDLLFGITRDGGTLRDDIQLSDGGCACPRGDLKPINLPTGRWVQVDLDYTFTGATLRYDGQEVMSGVLANTIPTDPITVYLGVAGYAEDQTSEYLFDDFVCTVTP